MAISGEEGLFGADAVGNVAKAPDPAIATPPGQKRFTVPLEDTAIFQLDALPVELIGIGINMVDAEAEYAGIFHLL